MAGTKQAVRKPVAAKTPRKAPAAKSVGKTTGANTTGKNVKRPRQTPNGKLKRGVAVTWQREFKKAVMESSRPAIPFAPFARLCREISENHLNGKLRFQETAIKALQEATENFIISVMEGVNLMCAHAKRVTIKQEDFVMYYKVMNTMPSPQNMALCAQINPEHDYHEFMWFRQRTVAEKREKASREAYEKRQAKITDDLHKRRKTKAAAKTAPANAGNSGEAEGEAEEEADADAEGEAAGEAEDGGGAEAEG
ncbi:hypothetical protein HYE67_006748 [Fusarium culmorum]|uniref:Core Histone H2A/H2B/H3 domain-containing protein n=1 Tax=Fusarium culmorum TaxID=5516 RepID=A0A7S8D9J5_FUSCU|nr:hypothetical protein HYE67_006748 [Fusarium culmorum]